MSYTPSSTSSFNAGNSQPVVSAIAYDQASPESKETWDQQVQTHGRMTNMKRTLARSSVALDALMTWYPLRDRVQAFLGERATLLFAHSISTETDCLICSTFFRKILIERGEDPDQLHLDDREQLVVELGRAIANSPNRIDQQILEKFKNLVSDDNLIDLIAFAGIMVATNIFNNVLRVPLDDYLSSFRKG